MIRGSYSSYESLWAGGKVRIVGGREAPILGWDEIHWNNNNNPSGGRGIVRRFGESEGALGSRSEGRTAVLLGNQ